MNDERLVSRLADLDRADAALVGGKDASLGEMIRHLGEEGVRVPGGFATTARAYRRFLDESGLEDRIRTLIDRFHGGDASLEETGQAIRGASRYYSPDYRAAFALECRALRRVRENIRPRQRPGHDPLLPNPPEEADRVLEVMAEQGLERGKQALRST